MNLRVQEILLMEEGHEPGQMHFEPMSLCSGKLICALHYEYNSVVPCVGTEELLGQIDGCACNHRRCELECLDLNTNSVSMYPCPLATLAPL